jgi:hypothetical protein
MTPPIDTNRPAPTTTKPPVDSREAAKARAHAPSEAEAPKEEKKQGGIGGMVERAVKRAKDAAASKDAKDGADTASKPKEDKTHKAITGAYDAVAGAIGGAASVAAKVAKPIYGPTVREAKEAVGEVAGAGKDVVTTAVDSANELRDEVGEVIGSDAPIGHKIVLGAYEVGENLVEGAVRQAGSVLNVGKEVVEGAAELVLNSPGVNVVKAGAEQAWKGVSALGGWFGDRISGGAEGAVKAASTGAGTIGSIFNRSKDQLVENVTEVGESIVNVPKTFINGWTDMFSEVGEVMGSDASIGHKAVLGIYEVGEGLVEGTGRTVAAAANVTKEIGEAAVENVVTTAQNIGDGIAGGFEAAGDFIGGLFG